jgi:hypothetical protein
MGSASALDPSPLVQVSGVKVSAAIGSVAQLRGLARLKFNDTQINGGVLTEGWVDVEAWGDTVGSERARVQFHRLIFDDASTTAPTGLTSASTGIQEWSAVPEPSSLALLALGAGGLLARRRRAA